jgi:hypothetical protein
MKCVILQPSYVPWRGVFEQILKADVFVFLDDVSYDRRGWRNRNRIKHPGRAKWLSIPVFSKGTRMDRTPLCRIEIDWDQPWARKHRETLRHVYHKAPFYERYAARLDDFYGRHPRFLADLTIGLTIDLAADLGITGTRFLRSSELRTGGEKTDRLLSILRPLGATHYITGPAARAYLEEEKFAEAGITIEYMTYEYQEYPQLHGDFDPQVSILDLILMTGESALGHITLPARSASCPD